MQLCKLYYDKPAKLLLALEQTTEFLTVQMERVALAEHQARCATTFNNKLKAYQNGLQLILQCRPIIDILCDRNNSQKQNAISNKIEKESIEEGKPTDEQKLIEDEESLVVLLEQRLQFILRSLTKLFVTKNSNSSKKESETFTNLYKQCYSKTLRPVTMSGFKLIQHIVQLLRELEKMLPPIET